MGEIGDVSVGATPKRGVPEFWGGDTPWVSSGDVAFCRISKTRETITAAGLGNRETRLHPPGTVLLAMIGEGKTRGQAAILDVAAAHNQNAASIRVHSDRKMLRKLPEGRYRIAGTAQENGKRVGRTAGRAWLTHDIPRGPRLVSPAEGATVPTRGAVADWDPVSRTITGKPVRIIAYQLIIEKDVEPHRHMIGKFGSACTCPAR